MKKQEFLDALGAGLSGSSDAKEVRIDTALLGAYLKSVKAAAAELREENDMTLSNALRLPDVTDIVEADEDDEAVKAAVAVGERSPYMVSKNFGPASRLYSATDCMRITALIAEYDMRSKGYAWPDTSNRDMLVMH